MRALVVVSLVVLGGCVDEEAPAKCVAFGQVYCEIKVEHCPGATVELCDEELEENLDCALAIGVGEDYELCLEELAALEECPFALPSECRGVVVLEEGALDDEDE